jgi:sec-independent protein translocase protein TatB
MFPLEQGAAEMVLIGVLALIVVGPKDLPVLMRRVGQMMAKMRGLAAEFRASFDEMARQSELDELRKEVENLRGAASAPLTNFQSEMDALNGAYANPPYGTPSPAVTTAPQPSVYEPTVYEEPPAYQEPRGFAFPPQPLAYEPPVFDTPTAEVAQSPDGGEPPAKPKPPRKPRAPKAAAPSVEIASTDPITPTKAPRKPRTPKAAPEPGA